MSLVSDLLQTIDEGRELLADVGLRPYTVSLLVVTHAGEYPGDGSSYTTSTPITVAHGKAPKVKVVDDKDIVQGGAFSKTRYEIGPLTPAYATGGVSPEDLEPPATNKPREVFYVLKGPGLPTNGMLCKKVADRLDSPFRYVITVETLGREAPAT